MAEILRYVNTASTAGGDGTTNATSGANRAYVDIGDLILDHATDAVADADNYVLYVDGAGGINRVEDADFAGWTTSETYDIRIAPIDDDVRAGTEWSESKPYFAGGNSQHAFKLGNTNDPQAVILDGLQFNSPTGGSGSGQAITIAALSGDTIVKIRGCHVQGATDRITDKALVSLQTNVPHFEVVNTIVNQRNTSGGGPALATWGTDTIFYNNTFIGYADTGSEVLQYKAGGSSGNHYLKNNIIEKTAGAGACLLQDGHNYETDANITSDATSPDTSFRNLTATFESSTDFALGSSDTNAKDAGVTLTSDSQLNVTDDIRLTSRQQGSSFDIGAHELLSSGSTLTTEAGAIAYAGADTLLGRLLDTEAGAHAYTGQDSPLARALETNPGALAYSGSLSYLARVLESTPGAWAYTGQDSSIGFRLATEAGAIAYTGQESELTRILETVAGSHVYAGQDTILDAGVTLTTEPGALTYTGQDSLLSRVLGTTPGAWVYTGQDSSIGFGIVLATEAGALIYSGQDSDLTRLFVTTPGEWAYVGLDSTINFAGNYYLEEAIAMAVQAIFNLRANTFVTLDEGGANESTGIRAIRQSRSFDPGFGPRAVMSDETEFLIEKETPRDLNGDPIVGVIVTKGMSIKDETNDEEFTIRRIEYDRSGITHIGIVNG